MTIGAEPLYIIDGFRLNPATRRHHAALYDIAPDDIESVEVIKGTEALSLYGAGAAGGVIVISTKDGFRPPEIHEFPEPRLRFRLTGNREVTRTFIESRLREAEIDWKREEEDPLTYLITWPIPEQRSESERRTYRVAMMLRIGESSPPSCSSVGVSWLRMSRGQYQRAWRTRPDDQSIRRPLLVDSIVRRLDAERTGKGCQ